MPEWNKQTILLIEDEESFRRQIASDLCANYDVLVARDGLDGIKVYERFDGRITAVITELEVPRLEGDLVADWIRRRNPKLPIIIMAGGHISIDLEILLREPKIELLQKPFTLHELESLLKELIQPAYESKLTVTL